MFLAAIVHLNTAHAASLSLADVRPSNLAYGAITYVVGHNIMEADKDQKFHPDRLLNRAEFIKTVVSASASAAQVDDCRFPKKRPYADVPSGLWFGPALCVAYQHGWVVSNSGKFRPADTISRAEAAKILAQAFGLHLPDPKKGDAWYVPAITALTNAHALTVSVPPTTSMTRANLAQIIWRLRVPPPVPKAPIAKKKAANISVKVVTAAMKCDGFTDENIPQVDLAEVRRVWLSWINDARADQELSAYQYESQLNRTATTWSREAKERGSITHKRPGQTAYYDYTLMAKWFENLGLEFKNVKGMTFTENIGWGYYKCGGADDCTQALIDGVRSTFDMYMAEKPKSYRPHYNSIMNPEFKLIGMGVAVDNGKYYVTTHYGTEITSQPPPVCQ